MPCIVVTHHAPSYASIPDQYKEDALNGAYASELSYDLFSLGCQLPKLWVHGHIHEAIEYNIDGMQVRCNPRGYFGHHEVASFNEKMVIDI